MLKINKSIAIILVGMTVSHRCPADFQINSLTDGDQICPRLAARPDGNIYALWVNKPSQTVRYRILDETGSFFATDAQISSNPSSRQAMPSIATYSDGGAFVTWVDSNYHIMQRIVNPNGKPSGADVKMLSGFDLYASSCVICLQSGNIMALTNYQSPSNALNFYAQEIDRAGNMSGGAILLDSRPLTSGTYSVLQLPNSSIFFAESMSGPTTALRYFLLDSTFTTSFACTNLPLHSAELGGECLACGAFANNTVLMAWPHVNQDGSSQLAGGIFDGVSGCALVSAINLSGSFHNATMAKVAGLAGAAFDNANYLLVVFAGQQYAYSDFNVYGSIVDPSGNVSGPFLINEQTAGDQLHPMACALPNGDVFVAWQGNQTGMNNIYGIALTAEQLQNFISPAAQQMDTDPNATLDILQKKVDWLLGCTAALLGITSIAGTYLLLKEIRSYLNARPK